VREHEHVAPGLYLVATPIGNLEDITLRALKVLAGVDRIACEDTRQTQKLLNRYGIARPTVSYHQHNESGRAAELVAELRAGGRIAVVSDAGTPGISDPGAKLVEMAVAAGVAVYTVPGANAAVSALVASGLPTERFAFHGFLPSRAGERRRELERLKAELLRGAEDEPMTQIFYEAPHRIVEALKDMETVMGAAVQVVVARELTKVHEEFVRGTAREVQEIFEKRDAVKGEMVLLVSGSLPNVTGAERTPVEDVAALMASGVEERDALKQVARERGVGKSELYRDLQVLKKR
jgi:16S rRNA (cytidine1402-2'-O)-methyltransferase